MPPVAHKSEPPATAAVGAAGQDCMAIGNVQLLVAPMLALFCSIKCPGELILKLFDLARELRDAEAGSQRGWFYLDRNLDRDGFAKVA